MTISLIIIVTILLLSFCTYAKPKKVTIDFLDIPVFARINTPKKDSNDEDLIVDIPFVGQYKQPPYSKMKGHFVQIGDWSIKCGFDNQQTTFVVPSKQSTDFASIPRVMHSLITPLSNSIYAAVLHDYLYRNPSAPNANSVTKQQADRIFYWGLRAKGVSKLLSGMMYRGVWLLGSFSYKREHGNTSNSR